MIHAVISQNSMRQLYFASLIRGLCWCVSCLVRVISEESGFIWESGDERHPGVALISTRAHDNETSFPLKSLLRLNTREDSNPVCTRMRRLLMKEFTRWLHFTRVLHLPGLRTNTDVNMQRPELIFNSGVIFVDSVWEVCKLWCWVIISGKKKKCT